MPDAELFNLAAQEQLTSPKVIKQLTRMLRDPKAESLAVFLPLSGWVSMRWVRGSAWTPSITLVHRLAHAGHEEESAMNFLPCCAKSQPLQVHPIQNHLPE